MVSPYLYLRAMRPEDYRQVAALWQRCRQPLWLLADSFAGVASFLARNPGLSVVAERGGTIVAAALCGDDGRAGYIHHLAVDPREPRVEVTRAVLRRCLMQLRAMGVGGCYLFRVGGVRFVEFGRRAPAGFNDSVVSLLA